MKKVLLLTAAFCILFVLSSQAQLRFGAKGGLNISDVSISGGSFSSDDVTGFQIGPSVEWLMIKNLGIDAAVLYSQRGIDIKEANIDKNIGYLDIPVNLKLMIGLVENFRPYATAGPYVSFNLSDKDISDQWKAESFGAGVNFGAGVELFKFVQLGANYGLGLTDDYKSISGAGTDPRNYTAKSRTWSVTAAIYF